MRWPRNPLNVPDKFNVTQNPLYRLLSAKFAPFNPDVCLYVDGAMRDFEEFRHGTASVAQHIFALILKLSNRVGQHAWSVAEGGGAKSDRFARSDVVSLHCPLTAETQGLVNSRRIELMKRSAVLVNTSRGPLIIEADLAAALNADRILGAAIDVLSAEPPAADHPLVSARNCVVSPHLAWAAGAARTRLMVTAAANACAYLAGSPRNVVNL